MLHQYKAGDVVTVFQLSASKELVIEGKATIRKKLRVEFANKPGPLYGSSIAGARYNKTSIGALRGLTGPNGKRDGRLSFQTARHVSVRNRIGAACEIRR